MLACHNLRSHPMAEDHSHFWRSDESTYRTRSAVRGLGWWVLLAIIVSVGVHFLLYIAFVELPIGDYFAKSATRKPWERERERIQISPELLKSADTLIPDLAPEPLETDKPLADLMMTDQELDLLEAQENMPDKEVKLTPDVAEITNFLKGEGGDPEAGGSAASNLLISALEDSTTVASAEAFEADIGAMKKSMLESGAASANQLLLNVGDLEDTSPPPSEALFEDLTKAERDHSGGVKGLQGFNTLDDLLGRAGKLPGNLEPVLMPTDLLFGYNEDTLRDNARLSLMKLGLLIQKNPDSQFIIEGHTDSFGSEDYNLALSQRRAEAVRGWLVRSLRLSTDGIRVRGYGKTRPLVDTSGDQNAQALNRRVEIVIRPKGQ